MNLTGSMNYFVAMSQSDVIFAIAERRCRLNQEQRVTQPDAALDRKTPMLVVAGVLIGILPVSFV